ncbi:hypothetical protein NAMH_1264 [Nautilia profundicola AmH]|uniref:Uncharacterized protein n=1 Tax=Nautilia profundicola (strain ATCC BAA-1463 / DSM 18972 / AmH) TaxID=598659 RepID=B9L5L9_NAUPA|nr:hypothetical protein [Nautilia profundicola]ACM92719.1 hypothetical protein NAMH_1264 [Nautilia profundicola AmH]
MKKLVILIGLLTLMFGEATTQKDIYLEYTNKVINYEFNIKNLSKVKSPFYEPPKFFPGTPNAKNVQIKKRVKITLLSIFENKAYIKVEEYLGEQLVSVTKKWISLNDKIYDCKLSKLTDTDAVFKCSDKTLYKTINKKIPMLRDKQ